MRPLAALQNTLLTLLFFLNKNKFSFAPPKSQDISLTYPCNTFKENMPITPSQFFSKFSRLSFNSRRNEMKGGGGGGLLGHILNKKRKRQAEKLISTFCKDMHDILHYTCQKIQNSLLCARGQKWSKSIKYIAQTMDILVFEFLYLFRISFILVPLELLPHHVH